MASPLLLIVIWLDKTRLLLDIRLRLAQHPISGNLQRAWPLIIRVLRFLSLVHLLNRPIHTKLHVLHVSIWLHRMAPLGLDFLQNPMVFIGFRDVHLQVGLQFLDLHCELLVIGFYLCVVRLW